MKVIFLDFDGVLCNHESISAGYKSRTTPEQDPYGPHAECVAALNHILKATNACIVVSSTWRRGCSVADTRRRMRRWGVDGVVIGVTPILNGDEYAYTRRGAEIQKWLADHPVVESFVILDDDSDMGDLRDRLVRTTYKCGLTMTESEVAIAMLNS